MNKSLSQIQKNTKLPEQKIKKDDENLKSKFNFLLNLKTVEKFNNKDDKKTLENEK